MVLRRVRRDSYRFRNFNILYANNKYNLLGQGRRYVQYYDLFFDCSNALYFIYEPFICIRKRKSYLPEQPNNFNRKGRFFRSWSCLEVVHR